ncbi:hypothetical protein JR316_0009490 [Psilocybe cubensis]|uniref:Uncharacterized protein n=1 Tax=Psilocybe cubensis TaxID=181762 RepID=A0ACB8GNZ7_PSICU|nr:hypothetical protein JR316_0009490 [Psilocybe cubensis]KAH9477286.1 hypothetical protein JR316_0009490 [Psilocybe cubensis]
MDSKASTQKALKSLAIVIKAGRKTSSLPSIGHFVRELELLIIGDRAYYHYREGALRPRAHIPKCWGADADSVLAYILRNLFQTGSSANVLRMMSPGPSRLTLRLNVDDPYSPVGQRDRFSWRLFSPEIQKALNNLVQSSQLNSVHLDSVKDIPKSFVGKREVKDVNIVNSSIEQELDIVNKNTESLFLESLNVGPIVTSRDLGLPASLPTFNIPTAQLYLPNLTRLMICHIISRHIEFHSLASTIATLNDILHHAPLLKVLSIEIKKENEGNLEHLAISQANTTQT